MEFALELGGLQIPLRVGSLVCIAPVTHSSSCGQTKRNLRKRSWESEEEEQRDRLSLPRSHPGQRFIAAASKKNRLSPALYLRGSWNGWAKLSGKCNQRLQSHVCSPSCTLGGDGPCADELEQILCSDLVLWDGRKSPTFDILTTQTATVSWPLYNYYIAKMTTCFVVIQLLSCVQLFAAPRTAAPQAPLSFTISLSLLKLMSIESVMLSNHLILHHPLLLSLPVYRRIRVFSKWVGSSHQMARVSELQRQPFQWIFRVDFL